MPSIVIQCESCGGSGLYQGFAEAKDCAVVCLGCRGQGWTKYSYKEFEGRKKKRGIKYIGISRGTFVLTGVGPKPESMMTYKEFEDKYRVNPPTIVMSSK